MNISVVIPAYNEEKRLGPSLERIIRYLSANFTKYEIIIVDDCSKDKTSELIGKYQRKLIKNKNAEITVLKNEKNMGKGFSVRAGILKAKYHLVLFSDSDLATPIEELSKMIKYSKDYDVIIASRNMKGSDVRTKQSLIRVLVGKTFPKVVSLIGVRGIKDTQCGFKLFRTSIARQIFAKQQLSGFAFDVEILYIARKMGFKIKEVPVVWIDKKGSKVNVIKDSIKMMMDLFKIRINGMSGKYN